MKSSDDKQVYRLVPVAGRPWLSYCMGRKLYLRPAKDCKNCAWYECLHHPRHGKWPLVVEMLRKCWTMNPKIRDPLADGRKAAWKSGEKKHCMRHNVMCGRYGVSDPCMTCTLKRPCEHRGERGFELARQVKAHHKREREDGLHYITKSGGKYVVRLQVGGKQTVIGRFDSIPEAKTARDLELLKLSGHPVDAAEYKKRMDVAAWERDP